MIGYVLAKAALFLGVGVVQHQRASVKFKLRGRGRGLAATGVTVVLGALVLADLPPFVSSDGMRCWWAADQAGLPWLELVIALTVGLSSGAVLRRPDGSGWVGNVETPSPGVGTEDDAGDEAEDRPDRGSTGGRPDGPAGPPDGRTRPAEGAGAADHGAAATGTARHRARARAGARPGGAGGIGGGVILRRAVYAAQVLGTGWRYRPCQRRGRRGGFPRGDLGRCADRSGPGRWSRSAWPRLALDRLGGPGSAGRWRPDTVWLCLWHSGLVGDQVTWLVAGLARCWPRWAERRCANLPGPLRSVDPRTRAQMLPSDAWLRPGTKPGDGFTWLGRRAPTFLAVILNYWILSSY